MQVSKSSKLLTIMLSEKKVKVNGSVVTITLGCFPIPVRQGLIQGFRIPIGLFDMAVAACLTVIVDIT